MRRRSAHGLFGAAALLCAGVAGWQALQWQQTLRLNAAIAQAARLPGGAASAAALPADAAPEVRLARAGALAQAGAHDAAFKAYAGLIRPDELDATGRQALYNLGNMLLRQGVALGTGGARSAEALPLIELAKQRYRDLLRATPGDWDARHNLERALRLAPEEGEALADEDNVPVERRRVMLRGLEPGDLP